MRANRARSTGPELKVRKILASEGLSGFLTNPRNLPGRPDIAFPDIRLAVFVHGCFWHQCPHCAARPPKSHTDFWVAKFKANKLRDASKARALRRSGWSVLTIWECQIREHPERVGKRITHAAQK
ncbi:MAG: very short patch repair endonuclease [Thermoplasmata archaeon]